VVRLTSRRDPVVQRFRRLAARRDRDAVLLDGEHLVREALDARIPMDLLLTDGRDDSLVDRAKAAGAAVYQATAAVLEAASPVRSPSGLIGIAHWTPGSTAQALDRAAAVTIGLVGVQDPGNVGAVIRSADAFDAGGVIALEGSADPAGWKALRGAMGSTFRLPIASGALADVIRDARRRGIAMGAAVPAGGAPLGERPLGLPLLLLLGNEGSGLDPALVASADQRVTIPMRPGLDSLNVAVTAALVLWEARRQRRQDPRR
jgi:TrmH family RNA methyltransferase